MSNYESIVPEKIETNKFDFHGALIEIVTDEVDEHGYRYFNGDLTFSKDDTSHFVEIKSDKKLIINRCDFTAILDEYEPSQNFTIESSIDGETWNTLYTRIIPKVSKEEFQPYSCEFKPTRCNYIRCCFSSATTSEIYNFCGGHFKFYGSLSVEQDLFLYTNPDAYGIPKEE